MARAPKRHFDSGWDFGWIHLIWNRLAWLDDTLRLAQVQLDNIMGYLYQQTSYINSLATNPLCSSET